MTYAPPQRRPGLPPLNAIPSNSADPSLSKKAADDKILQPASQRDGPRELDSHSTLIAALKSAVDELEVDGLMDKTKDQFVGLREWIYVAATGVSERYSSTGKNGGTLVQAAAD